MIAQRCNAHRKIIPIITGNVFLQCLLLLLCMGFLYSSTILSLIRSWWQDCNYSHGFLVPLISLYLIWQRRDKLQHLESSPNYWGALFILFGGAMLILGEFGSVVFLEHFSLIWVIVGLTITLLGYVWFKALILPLAYLIFMVPLPPSVLNIVASPLQLLAASFSNLFLGIFNVPVVVDNNFIFLPNITLFVAPGCAGIRYIIPVLVIAVALAYLMLERWLYRTILVGGAIVMAVLTNLFRVATTGFLAYFVSVKLAGGSFHSLYGWSLSIVDFVFLWAIALLLFRRERPRVETGEHHKGGDLTCNSTLPTYRFPRAKYTRQFYLAVIILISFAVCFHASSHRRLFLPKSLAEFPLIIDRWKGKDLKVVAEMPEIGGIDDSLVRAYSDDLGHQVKFYVGYSSNQRRRAKVFLPPGELFPKWSVIEQGKERLIVSDKDGRNIEVSRYIVQSCGTRLVVLCWYQSGEKSMASVFRAKGHLIITALTQHRFDGAFACICMPVIDSVESTSARVRNFAELIVPLLSDYTKRD